MKASPTHPAPHPHTAPARVAWVVALVALLAAGFLGVRLLSLRSVVKLSETEAELACAENQMLRQQLEAERIIASREIGGLRATIDDTPTTLLSLGPPAGRAGTGSLVWLQRSQKAQIVATGLPETAADKALWLWVVGQNGRTLPVGRLPDGSLGQPGHVVTLEQPLGAITAAMVTVEDAAAVPTTPGTLVLSSNR